MGCLDLGARNAARWKLSFFLLLLSLLASPAALASPSDLFVTVIADTNSAAAGLGTSSGRPGTNAALKPWLQWARMESAPVFLPRIVPKGVLSAQATRTSVGASVLVDGPAAGSRLHAKTGAVLEAGLYRVEAAVMGTRRDDDGLAALSAAPPRLWRMESVLLARPGMSTKLVRLLPDQTLIVRWTETISEARFRLQTARRTSAAQGGPTTYTGITIAKALGQAARRLGEVQTLAARGNRAEIARRTHLALLSVAQAQAMARNRPGAVPGDADDRAFTELTLALSEISAAACNLVPSEARTLGADGSPTGTRVSLTNAGRKTIPLVTLALPASADAAAMAQESRRRVFRSVRPGATITALFPPSAPADPGVGAKAVVQFIVGMGAAVVTAAPPP